MLFLRYQLKVPKGEHILAWEKPYFATLILSSLIWGIGCVIIMPVDSPLHQAITYFFLIGMSGGAISVYSAHRPMTLASIASVLLPATGWFLLQGDIISLGMAIGAIMFFISAIRAGKVLSLAMHKSFMLSHELRHSKKVAENLARTDELTGLNNRRAFYEQGQIYINYCRRNEEALSLIVMDIDHFKNINDTFGHAAGDIALQRIGEILQQTVRNADICARIGGEEFAILILASTLEETMQLAERLRTSIAQKPLMVNRQSLAITASFGLSTGSYDLDTLIKCADDNLYKAKKTGRNRVIYTKCAHE